MRLDRTSLLAVLGYLALAILCVPAVAQTYYIVAPMGTLDQTTSEAFGLNAYGQAVGRVPIPDDRPHAFHWQNGEMKNFRDAVHFPQLFLTKRGECYEVSDGDLVVGGGWNKIRVNNEEIFFIDAFVYRPAVTTDLITPYPGGAVTALTPVGDFQNSAAVSINNSARVAGASPNYVVGWYDIDTSYRFQAFLVTPLNGQWYVGADPATDPNQLLVNLGSLHQSNTESSATGVNDSGEVVGYSYTFNGGYHAFLIRPEDTNGDGLPDRWFRDNDANGANDLMQDLGTLGGKNSWARGISNRVNGAPSAWIVGEADTATFDTHAFFWQADGQGMIDLGTLGGDDSSASRINDRGQVVGWAETADQSVHAFVVTPEDTNNDGRPDRWFRDDDGDGINDLMVDLNEALLAGSKWTLVQARDINESGEIVGWGTLRGSDASVQQGFFLRVATPDEVAALLPPAAGGGTGGGGGGGGALVLNPLLPGGSGGGQGGGDQDDAGAPPTRADCGAGLLFGVPLTLLGLAGMRRRGPA